MWGGGVPCYCQKGFGGTSERLVHYTDQGCDVHENFETGRLMAIYQFGQEILGGTDVEKSGGF
jgi:hypothetical protein